MRKICVVIVIFLFLSLLACSNYGERPENVREGVYRLGLEAISIADDYLDFRLTARNAIVKLDDLNSRFDEFSDLTSEEMTVSSHLWFTSLALSYVTWGIGTYEDVLERRNNLAERLNERAREN